MSGRETKELKWEMHQSGEDASKAFGTILKSPRNYGLHTLVVWAS
jgi:hypothetical protein